MCLYLDQSPLVKLKRYKLGITDYGYFLRREFGKRNMFHSKISRLARKDEETGVSGSLIPIHSGHPGAFLLLNSVRYLYIFSIYPYC